MKQIWAFDSWRKMSANAAGVRVLKVNILRFKFVESIFESENGGFTTCAHVPARAGSFATCAVSARSLARASHDCGQL